MATTADPATVDMLETQEHQDSVELLARLVLMELQERLVLLEITDMLAELDTLDELESLPTVLQEVPVKQENKETLELMEHQDLMEQQVCQDEMETRDTPETMAILDAASVDHQETPAPQEPPELWVSPEIPAETVLRADKETEDMPATLEHLEVPELRERMEMPETLEILVMLEAQEPPVLEGSQEQLEHEERRDPPVTQEALEALEELEVPDTEETPDNLEHLDLQDNEDPLEIQDPPEETDLPQLDPPDTLVVPVDEEIPVLLDLLATLDPLEMRECAVNLESLVAGLEVLLAVDAPDPPETQDDRELLSRPNMCKLCSIPSTPKPTELPCVPDLEALRTAMRQFPDGLAVSSHGESLMGTAVSTWTPLPDLVSVSRSLHLEPVSRNSRFNLSLSAQPNSARSLVTTAVSG